MTDQIKLEEVGPRSKKGARRSRGHLGGDTWQSADAARFLFKGQCYDAGPGFGRTCGLCGGRIRLVYVLKVIESPSHSCSPEVGKLLVGECCFRTIEAVNEKLYHQLLAAAVNLRTYTEAIERDRRIFADRQEAVASEKVELPRLQVPGLEEDSVRQLFETLVSDGGDHA